MKMRLSPEMGVQKMGETEDADILWHLTTMYGGNVGKYRSPVNDMLLERYTSRDESIVAVRPVHGKQMTTVRIHSLELPHQAARWTALQAYREKGGVALNRLAIETSDLAIQQEWHHRTSELGETVFGNKADFSIVASPRFDEDEFGEWNKARRKGLDSVSKIIATGHSLPDSAERLAKGYKKLDSRSRDRTSEETIARCLGTTSVKHLRKIWAVAMDEETPLDAGVVVAHILDA